MSIMALVYGIKDPRDGSYFYVGATDKSTDERMKAHLFRVRCGSSQAVHIRMAEIIADNLMLEMTTMEVLESTDGLSQAEMKWIHTLREQGHPLVNQRELPWVQKRKTSMKGRENMSAAKLSFWKDNKDTRRDHSERMKAWHADPANKATVLAAAKKKSDAQRPMAEARLRRLEEERQQKRVTRADSCEQVNALIREAATAYDADPSIHTLRFYDFIGTKLRENGVEASSATFIAKRLREMNYVSRVPRSQVGVKKKCNKCGALGHMTKTCKA